MILIIVNSYLTNFSCYYEAQEVVRATSLKCLQQYMSRLPRTGERILCLFKLINYKYEFYMSSLTLEVSQVSELHFQGNIVPSSFFKNIRIKTKTGSKPDLMAANLLSDLLYWYRPSEKRDDNGNVIGFKNKFKGDYLQRSYKHIADMFDVCRQTAKRVVDRLIDAGLIRKVIIKKLVLAGGRVLSNVMHLVPVSGAIAKIMSEESSTDKEACSPQFEDTPSYQDRPHPPINFDPTYTETNHTEIFPSITPSTAKERSTPLSGSTNKKAKKNKAPETITAFEVDSEAYPLAASAMQQFQRSVDEAVGQGSEVNLYLDNLDRLTVRPENLIDIECNMSALLNYDYDNEGERFLLSVLLNTYNKRLHRRDRPANFAMVAGVGMEDYESFIVGSELYCDE